jgi:hypothetical protein
MGLIRRRAILFASFVSAASAGCWILAGLDDRPVAGESDAGSDGDLPDTALGEADVPCKITAAQACAAAKGSFDAGPDADDAGPIPEDLACTGLYTCWDPKIVAVENRPYVPGVALWSDGAEKQRWLHLPPGSKIETSDAGTAAEEWTLPIGTKVWKEFRIAGKRVETRLVWKREPETSAMIQRGPNVAFGVFRWNAEESTARRLDVGETNVMGTYEIPGTEMCVRCHQGRIDGFLSIESISMALPTASGVTLATLRQEDRFTPPMAEFAPAWGSEAELALGWLHANCGFCHNPTTGQAAFTGLHMRLHPGNFGRSAGDAGQPALGVRGTDTFLTAVDQPITQPKYTGDPRFAGFLRIARKQPSTSLVHWLDTNRATDGGIDPAQMPPILSRKVDDQGQMLVGAFILGL